MHRRAIQVAAPLPILSTGSSFVVEDEVLVTESGLQLNFNHALQWKKRNISIDHAISTYDLQKNIRTIFDYLETLPLPPGFGIYIQQIKYSMHGHTTGIEVQISDWTVSQQFAWPSIQRITRACRTRDLDAIFNHAMDLIGLGEGLTPSGDDFIGGLLFCIQTLQDLFDDDHLDFSDLVPEFLRSSKPRTNLISYTVLKDHASGHTYESLQDSIQALLTGMDQEILRQAIHRLIKIGHSTGWDMLCGMLTGLLILNDFSPPNVIGLQSGSASNS